MRRAAPLLVLAAYLATAGCSDPNSIPDASLTNVIDTVTIYSLESGPLTSPTAYSLAARQGVRTWDVGTNFEFAFTMKADSTAVLLPLDALGLANPNDVKPGLKPTTLTFDGMTKGPRNGYTTSDSLTIAEGDRLFLRTSTSPCPLYGVPLYGKLEVLDIDSVAGTLTFRVLANQNCAYRNLGLGIPKS